jgi:hypothetical protein
MPTDGPMDESDVQPTEAPPTTGMPQTQSADGGANDAAAVTRSDSQGDDTAERPSGVRPTETPPTTGVPQTQGTPGGPGNEATPTEVGSPKAGTPDKTSGAKTRMVRRGSPARRP